MASFIDIIGGKVTLESVRFVNVTAGGSSEYHAVVTQNRSCTFPFCGDFQYIQGSVEYVNNGYEYSDLATLSGFLSAHSIASVFISNVNFSYSLIVDPSTTDLVSGYSLLFLEDFIQLTVTNCLFYSNIATGGIITVKSAVELPKTSDKGVAVEYALPHITLSGLNFTRNYVEQSIIHIVFSGDLQNVVVEKCVFVECAVHSQAVISILSNQELTQILVSGGGKSVIVSDAVQILWFAKRSIMVSNVVFANVSSYSSLFRIENCANLQFFDVLIVNCGNSEHERIMEIFQLLIANPQSSVKKLPSPIYSTLCSASFAFQEVVNVRMQEIQILNSACTEGVGLMLDHANGTMAVSDWVVKQSSGKGVRGLVFHFLGEYFCTFTNITVEDCEMGGNGMMYFQDYAVVFMSASRFDNNRGERGACLRADSGLYLTLWNSTFTRNSSPLNVGGVLAFFLSETKWLKAQITDCVFAYNSGTEGGVLAFGGFKVLAVDLILLRNQFSYNLATERAAVLAIQPVVSLSELSRVENCTFEGNYSPFGAISAMQSSGSFNITSSFFVNNSGETCSNLHIESASTAQVILIDVTFLDNKKGPVILKTNQRILSHIRTQRCSFRRSEMGAVSLEGGEWTDENSTYAETHATVLSLSLGGNARLSRGTFLENTNVKEGGAIYLSSRSSLTCDYCLFRNNTAQSGVAVYSEQDSILKLSHSMIEGNTAISVGSAIVLTTSLHSESLISNCTFRYNVARQSSLILSQNAVLTMSAVTIHENRAAEYPGISIVLSKAELTNCIFSNQQSASAPFIFVSTLSSISIKNSDFMNGTGTDCGALSIMASDISILNSTFSNITGTQSGAISIASGNVSLIEVYMHSIDSASPGSLIFAMDSSISIADSVFTEYEQGGIKGIQLSTMKVIESRFADGVGSLGGAISCTQCTNLTIAKSEFASHQGMYGGAIYLETTEGATESGSFLVTATDFSNNQALAGGTVYLRNMKMDMDKCTFFSSKAIDDGIGEGGALMLDCSIEEFCRFHISNSVFQANSAVFKGGAISWRLSKPTIVNEKMIHNRAKYAPDVASFPIKMSLLDITVATGRVLKVRNSTEVWEVPPGQAAGLMLRVSLIDHYAHLVNIDNSSVAEIAAANSTVLVVGKTKVTAVNGVFLFDDFQIYAIPGSSATINIYSSSISPNQPGDSDPHFSTLPLTFHMRDCLPGEYQTNRSCYTCESGTYGFEPSQPCEKCPANARCLGNYTIYPDSGYWRSGIYSAKIWECPNPEACKGGQYNDTYNLTGACAAGYTGNMCQSCARHYSRTTKNKCGKCPDQETNIIRIVFIALGVFILNVVMTLSTLNSSLKPKSLHSIYLKILINYLQLVLLVTDFKLEWPNAVLKVFDTQEKSGEVAEQAYSIDCLLADENHFHTHILFQKVIVMSILPLLIFGLAILLWGVAAVYTKKSIYLSRELTATCIITFFMIHPNLMLLLLSMFSCIEIDPGEYWLTRDMQIRCWESDHLLYSLALAVPAAVVWIIMFPLLSLLVLIKNRRRQDEVDMKMRFGFLISGYNRRHYYWEFVIMYRKFAIICCSVFLTSSVHIQALTVQLVILVFLYLQSNTLPYTEAVLNSLELKAIIVANLTIYCGLYYLTKDLSSSSSWFFFYVILLSNLVFLAYWLIYFMDFVVYNLLRKVPALARIVAPGLVDNDPFIEDFLDNLALKSENATNNMADVKMKDIHRSLLTRPLQSLLHAE